MKATADVHPLREPAERDLADGALALRAAAGDRAALAELLERHQSWVYAIALRMVREPADAADLAQEALLRVVTRISQFAGRSSFRTWAYRIVVNCFLDAKRSRSEQFFSSFVRYGEELDRLGLAELRLEPAQEAERALIVEETKIGCMLGMLLCLTREQRIAFILGAIFEVPSDIAGEVLGLSPTAFRKRLERARADLASFMNAKCGLVNPNNPCRCPKKTAVLIREGWVDPERLRFVDRRLQQASLEAPRLSKRFEDLVAAAPEDLFRAHPRGQGPDFARRIDRLLQSRRLLATKLRARYHFASAGGGMAQVLIRDLDPKLVDRFKDRAREHGRSLEAELRGILEAAADRDLGDAKALAARIRRRLSGRVHSDSAALVSEDRGR